MDVKLLALDLDGTVLRSDNTLSPVVGRALEKAAASGIEVAVASGRPFGSMPREILSIDGVDYVIASNGAAIYHQHKRIFSDTLRPQDVQKILALTAGYDLIWEAFLDGETCTDRRYYDDPVRYGCSRAYIDYVRGSRAACDDMRGFIERNRHRLDSVEFVCTDKDLREHLWASLEKAVPDVYITSSSRNFVEFMNGTATKANALRKLCELLDVDQKNTAAAGNADNDVDMLLFAGTGAAVRNATPKCLDAADLIVDTNDNDGIAELVEYLVES